MFLSVLLALCLSLEATYLVGALPVDDSTFGPYLVVEERQEAVSPWTYLRSAAEDAVLHLDIALKRNEENDLAAKLMELSDPSSTHYGKHLNHQELRDFTAPSPKTIEVVDSWLQSVSGLNNVTYRSDAGSYSFDIMASDANAMFKAEFGVFVDLASGEIVTRSLKYSLPLQVSSRIALVHPITYFPRAKPSVKKQEVTLPAQAAKLLTPTPIITERVEGNATELLAACQSITPGCIAALYNINYTPPRNETPSGSSLAIAGFLEQYINHTDIDSWVRKHGNSEDMRANPGTFAVELVNGGTNNESYYATGVEATLDMEYSMPFVGSLPVTYYSVGGRPPALDANGALVPDGQTSNEPYLELLTYLLAKPDAEIPHVLSISYTDTEQSIPRDYALHVCDLFGQLAARGVSVIDASGDGGVAGQSDMDCISNDAAKTPKFLPTFPASCPYVTAVGWTYILPEEWGNSHSSGGFSDYFGVPEYQRNSTAAYIATLEGQYSGLYNASGRGIPDVSLYGSRYETENNNVTSGYHSGTSAGTPVVASMIALVNDIRLRKGLPVLGWLNPLLYSAGLKSVFNDVVLGNSYGCGESWNATVGWDAVTGLGSVDFARLAAVLG